MSLSKWIRLCGVAAILGGVTFVAVEPFYLMSPESDLVAIATNVAIVFIVVGACGSPRLAKRRLRTHRVHRLLYVRRRGGG